MSLYELPGLLIYSCVLAFILGAVMGSFLNCAAYRVSHGQSFIKGHSRCPSCGHELGAADLVPIFSWLFLRGKCRYCGTHVSVRYLLTELFFAAAAVLTLLRFDLSIGCLQVFLLACLLFFLSLVDMEIMIIPDRCLIAAVVLYAVTVPFTGTDLKTIGLHVLAGLVLGGAILLISLLMDRILGRDSMGGGDIKLFAVAGLYLGFAKGLLAIILSCVFGLVFAVFTKKKEAPEEGEVKDKSRAEVPSEAGDGEQVSSCTDDAENDDETDPSAFPFGPSIALALWLVLLFGDPVISWYLGLFGL